MKVFISHNKADKEAARTLAMLLVEQGVDVWFDEWEIRPGDSIVGGIEGGLQDAEVFILLWSKAAQASEWVGMETRAFIRKRIDETGMRIVPLMMDDTKLPPLVADYRGFDLSDGAALEGVVEALTGQPRDIEVAQRLQRKLNEITALHTKGDPLGYLVCPSCGSDKLKRSSATDPARDDTYYMVDCEECEWSDWTQ